MKHTAALAFALCTLPFIAGCDIGPASRGDLKQERSERLDTDDALRSELRSLADRVERLEREQRVASRVSSPVAITVPPNGTAQLALKAQLKDVSARGVCGQEPPERLPGGGMIIANRECTEADLR